MKRVYEYLHEVVSKRRRYKDGGHDADQEETVGLEREDHENRVAANATESAMKTRTD